MSSRQGNDVAQGLNFLSVNKSPQAARDVQAMIAANPDPASAAPLVGAGIRTSTWANLPLAESVPNQFYWVTDVSPSGSLWRSNGVVWSPINGNCLLGQGGVAQTVTAGSTAEEVLALVPIPAGLVGPNGALRLSTLWSATVNANPKSLRARLGSVALSGSAVFASTSAMQNQAAIAPTPHVIRNRNALNSQICFPAANGGIATVSGSPVTAFTENTGADLVFAITGQKTTGSDTLTLEGWSLELLRP